jgi:hypothetical protein
VGGSKEGGVVRLAKSLDPAYPGEPMGHSSSRLFVLLGSMCL